MVVSTARGTLALHGLLDVYLPDDAPPEHCEIDLPPASTVRALLEMLDVPLHRVHLVYVNGALVVASQWSELVLRPDDEVDVWPLLAGG